MIKIFCQEHVLFAANLMVKQLAKLGIDSRIVEYLDYYGDDLYLIYNSHTLSRLPKNYVVMQTEVCGSHWFNRAYLATLRGAKAVWDYSEENLRHYKRDVHKTAIVTPGIDPQPEGKKGIEYLFYGWIQGSDRRARIVPELERELNLNVITNLTGQPMWDILARTKTVVNVHYYDNSPLELYRLNESLSYGCKVLLHDEGIYYENRRDNFEEIKQAIFSL